MDRRKFLRASGLAAIAAAVSKTTLPSMARVATEVEVDHRPAVAALREMRTERARGWPVSAGGSLLACRTRRSGSRGRSVFDDTPFTVAG